MSGKRNVSVCSGHELANALYSYAQSFTEDGQSQHDDIFLWNGQEIVKFTPRNFTQITITEYSQHRQFARIVYLKGKFV